jgi:hypothetical protein
MLIDQGFTVFHGELVFAGFGKIRSSGRQKVFLVKITATGPKAIGE